MATYTVWDMTRMTRVKLRQMMRRLVTIKSVSSQPSSASPDWGMEIRLSMIHS